MDSLDASIERRTGLIGRALDKVEELGECRDLGSRDEGLQRESVQAEGAAVERLDLRQGEVGYEFADVRVEGVRGRVGRVLALGRVDVLVVPNDEVAVLSETSIQLESRDAYRAE